MSMLSKIQRGRQAMPPRLVVYGTEGIGKSTFAAQAPTPIFVPIEDGLSEIDCDRFPLATSFAEVMAALSELHSEKHDYQTVAIDSLDWLEQLIFDALCREYSVSSIEKVDGGYAKGYTHALGYWRQFLDALNLLRVNRGMVVICIAHAKVEKFEDPESTAYDRYSPRLHKHASALVCEWSDAVLFATRKFRTQQEDSGFNRKRTIAKALGKDGGERILRCVGGPSCIAKNRYSIAEELPLSWQAFVSALTSQSPSSGEQQDG
ncbi:MAG: ATP-binding protein [Planctomycetales bacterium]|nr:ATP-binding protein [Planctomycetales bacterium]